MEIRNFVIIAHIDHGKSTLADRMLEITGTVEKRKMREQFLDMNPLEREKGITIKMAPVRMNYMSHFDRGNTQKNTQNNAEDFLYEDLTYKIRGILFEVRRKIGLGHKEQVYHNALEIEFQKAGLAFESKKNISIIYEGKTIGIYQPDFLVENKVLIELKAIPEIGRSQTEQLWSYLKGCDYKLALLINFGSKELEIKRVVYDTARIFSASSASSQRMSAGVSGQVEKQYILNLIDTPGHVDFTYEVSRALAAVEGAILLVDATQGVQAQTLANLNLAQKENLKIIPVVNKIDLPSAEVEKTVEEIVNLLGVEKEDILKISGKTGEGVERLLEEVAQKITSPAYAPEKPLRALVFDSLFDPYQGVIAYVRVVEGTISKGARIRFLATGFEAESLEIGTFSPDRIAADSLSSGEIGYVATGIKEPERVKVGDTVVLAHEHRKFKVEPLAGYREPAPMVFASLFPEDQNDHESLRESLKKLKLNDAALTFEPEDSSALGRGFRAGFLGMLHMEIVSERLLREYDMKVTFTNPSVAFRIKSQGVEQLVFSASKMPELQLVDEIAEPWATVEVVTPPQYLGALTMLVNERSGTIGDTTTLAGDRLLVRFEAPLREVIIDFYDKLKSISQGFASMSYEVMGFQRGDLVRLDILVAGDKITALSEMIPKDQSYHIGKMRIERLKELLPRELFTVALQAEVEGRIIARETISALKKDVTGYLYGGDRTRKMKLWKKQQRGKKRLKESGHVDIPPEVFLKLLKK